jgi:hypothetical protein
MSSTAVLHQKAQTWPGLPRTNLFNSPLALGEHPVTLAFGPEIVPPKGTARYSLAHGLPEVPVDAATYSGVKCDFDIV